MAISRMIKVQIVSLHCHREDIVNELQEVGLIEIEDLKDSPLRAEYEVAPLRVKDDDTAKSLSGMENSLKFLSKFRKKSPSELFMPKKASLSEKRFHEIISKFPADEVIRNCNQIESSLREITLEEEKLLKDKSELLLWQDLDMQLDELGATRKTNFAIGSVPRERFNEFSKKVKETANETFLREVTGTKTDKYFILVYLREYDEKISWLLRESGFTHTSLPLFPGKPKDALKKIDERLAKIEAEKKELEEKGEHLSRENLEPIMVISDHLLRIKEKKEAQNLFLKTNEAFILTGWMREEDFSVLEKRLSHKFAEVALAKIKPQKGESPPIALKNKKSIAPFEMVTKLYGLPHHKEFDPTPFLAPFFFIFFGLCLSDVGYGVALMALSLLGMKKITAGRQFFQLFFLSGASAAVAGALLGGWLGIEVASLPHFLRQIMLFNPIETPMPFLYLSLALGTIQIIFGTTIKLVQGIKNKEWFSALFSEGAWLVIFAGILLFMLGEVLIGTSAAAVGAWMTISGALTYIFLRGLGQGEKLKSIALGPILLLNGAKDLLGNVLSYARLMALGMATSIIAMTVNIIAGLALAIPLIGWAVMILILVMGHAGNFLISTLGAFIHTARLQFVEFFPYFFIGGGRIFKPFQIENKFTIIDRAS